MYTPIPIRVLPQPDDFSCGPTCLHAVYRYYGDKIPLQSVIDATPKTENGGTLGVHLAVQALRNGYTATIYTFNLELFDPTWFGDEAIDLSAKLREQLRHKRRPHFQGATQAYLDFLQLGGIVRFQDLNAELLRHYLRLGTPILTGLSATYLYRSAREYGPNDDYDDIRGTPQGHFVILCGYDRESRKVSVADPMQPNPVTDGSHYEVGMDRLIGAILLGTLTYDDNILVLQKTR